MTRDADINFECPWLLTPYQITEWNLPTRPTMISDSRANPRQHQVRDVEHRSEPDRGQVGSRGRGQPEETNKGGRADRPSRHSALGARATLGKSENCGQSLRGR